MEAKWPEKAEKYRDAMVEKLEGFTGFANDRTCKSLNYNWIRNVRNGNTKVSDDFITLGYKIYM